MKKLSVKIGDRRPPWILTNENGVTSSSYSDRTHEETRFEFCKFLYHLKKWSGEKISLSDE